ncbi:MULTISPECIES: winged helix-turn-helix domain-containing protein [Enterobacterales]|uniref:winged helix-turn-helix domain-containing protein n=1 Tax=Enterobacterales TaxID=91347 RepID=UPI000DCB8E1B|nr:MULTISPECIES: LysR family transcriptional regulator [Enterobacterales]HEN3291988.1 LysR family transcriptional regulator [Yersinia enterocolitica]MCB5308823.1 LysR family transcriptional regulator [Yersinia massiliensis]RAW71985.1 ModE family transcriptional regulator [Photorhabdus sp. S7-51]RAW73580.1 ModE family transcriptional regulator [Photorhabdus sp. S14-60]RAW78514.1 ModE family transcriptional regulator [Photorhabdus sp. S15-56]
MNKNKKFEAVIVRPRVYLTDSISIGPGKIDLLKMIDQTHSISAAARALELPYKRAWLLVDTLNQGFERPVVLTSSGGKKGGGSTLTPLGQQLIERYELLEKKINSTVSKELNALNQLVENNEIGHDS